jgi:hypothetical protein
MIFTNSPKSQFVYNDLSDEQSRLQKAVQSNYTNTGVTSTSVGNYKVPSAALDQLALQKLVVINSKKLEISTITTNNFNTYSSSCGSSGCGIGTSTSFSSSVIVGASKTTVGYDCGVTTYYAGKAEVRQDILCAWNFPVLETVNSSAEFYTDGETYTQVTSGNLGIGKTSVLCSDTSDLSGLQPTATLIGYYYPIDPSASGPGCAGAISSVTSITNEIITLRSEINSLTTDINTIKDEKTTYQIDLWYENKATNDFNNRSTNLGNATSTMTQYQQVIADYEATT